MSRILIAAKLGHEDTDEAEAALQCLRAILQIYRWLGAFLVFQTSMASASSDLDGL